MGTLNEDLTEIKSVEDILASNKVARFAYTENAYNNNDANGVDVYNVDNEQNIPNGTASIMKVNQTVINKGYRAQASSITRMLMNHFLGRLSYNVNKVNDNMSSLLSTLQSHLGTSNGVATLDASGRVPYSQLPESAMELKGEWNASTNTPTLADGTGNNGDFYIVTVAGTQTFGGVAVTFSVNDRIIYNGSTSKWLKLSAGEVRKVNNVSPDSVGNVTLTANDVNAVPSSTKGQANGIATLDSQGKLTSSQLPASVGEVKKVNNILPTNGNVTLTGADISISTNETTKLSLLDNVVNHNTIWGGRELNSIISVDNFCTQVSANGYCKGVYVGDYWTFNGIKFRIVEFDSFYNQGKLISKNNSTFGNLHHAVIMPDTSLGSFAWDTNNSTNNGYAGSSAFSTTLPALVNTYNVASYFNGHILYKQENLSKACSTGKITATARRTAQMVLPSCVEVCGSPSCDKFSSDTMINCLTGGNTHQFSAFRLNPSLIFLNEVSAIIEMYIPHLPTVPATSSV